MERFRTGANIVLFLQRNEIEIFFVLFFVLLAPRGQKPKYNPMASHMKKTILRLLNTIEWLAVRSSFHRPMFYQ